RRRLGASRAIGATLSQTTGPGLGGRRPPARPPAGGRPGPVRPRGCRAGGTRRTARVGGLAAERYGCWPWVVSSSAKGSGGRERPRLGEQRDGQGEQGEGREPAA